MRSDNQYEPNVYTDILVHRCGIERHYRRQNKVPYPKVARIYGPSRENFRTALPKLGSFFGGGSLVRMRKQAPIRQQVTRPALARTAFPKPIRSRVLLSIRVWTTPPKDEPDAMTVIARPLRCWKC